MIIFRRHPRSSTKKSSIHRWAASWLKEMLRKFSFPVTCFYSLEKKWSLLEIETYSALLHSRDPMYTLRRWSSVFDINDHKFRLSTFVNRNAIHRCNRKSIHLKGSETSEANKSRVTRARLQIWKGEYKIGNWKHTKSSTAEYNFFNTTLTMCFGERL